MDLRRVKNAEKLVMCRRYYLAGFFALPFLWIVNSVWFFQEAFRKPQYTEQAEIKTYVIRSFIGSVIWLAIVIVWVTIFQLKRVDWGSTGDALLFSIPHGSA
ncbi:gamma-secretase subunit PEN-2 [Elysia marginata]|uniref:Gamma-secretase subunit PEN-2 n=1 Tax=Elysia marginata TaxID=1093978 RepID=A0AAV4GQV6_9GAST|nr:gamma-secretase subunit PEN-2 [Elysia marginata]